MGHVYKDDFFRYIEEGSFASAREMTPLLFNELQPQSLLDVGCGRGAWAKVWSEVGVSDVHGLDGSYVDTGNLHIPRENFYQSDLSAPFDLGRRFDVVTSLEVAEHLPPDSSKDFVASLVKHSDIVLFSAATPGQGGENHINERPLEFWRSAFAEHRYYPYDFIRPLVVSNKKVNRWYRFNSLVYVKDTAEHELGPSFKLHRVRDDEKIANRADLFWRCRLAVVSIMPRVIVDWIAMSNAKFKARRYMRWG